MTTLSDAALFELPPEDFDSQLGVAACYCLHDGKYLFLKRNIGKSQGGLWGVPAGKMEGEENGAVAVLREVEEETGFRLVRQHLEPVGVLYVRYPHLDFTYYSFHYTFEIEPEVRLARGEHSEYRWVTASEALKLPLVGGAGDALLYYLRWRGELAALKRG